jgi:uncharacterized protein (DUF3820 family)
MKGVDPFDLLGIVQTKSSPWGQKTPASTAQKQFLSTRNVDASKIDKYNASLLIGEIKKREEGMMPFGSHAGKPLEHVPRGYVMWLMRQKWFESKRDLRAELCRIHGIRA